jgi:hypothetical protein
MGLSAVGAFAKVPLQDGSGFVSCFVIAALDMPLGGPPFFFVTGLLGGLGLNRQLQVPTIQQVPNNLFIQTLEGFSDPMAALRGIKEFSPTEYGSFWFAVGLKFTTFQIVESKAVLFIKLDSGFTVGIVGLSSLSLPSKEFNIGYVELAFLAYYSSEENLLWVQAQLTDASYLFDKSCRLTGGFALVTWFNTGEFLLSLGGYHPKFNVPSYYPTVPRLGFSWKPTSSISVKGGAYFTICSSAVMIGGNLDANFNAGMISAGFSMGMNVLIVFDPFYYAFDAHISIYVRFKCYIKIWGVKIGKTFKATIGAYLDVEGPKMRGKAKIKLAFVTFTVKFGASSSRQLVGISKREFLNKHVRQLPEGELHENPETSGEVHWSDEWYDGTVLQGVIRPGDKGDEDQLPDGTTSAKAWQLNPEFDLVFTTKFPATDFVVKPGGIGSVPAPAAWNGGERSKQGVTPAGELHNCNAMQLGPTLNDSIVDSLVTLRIFAYDDNTATKSKLGVLDLRNADYVTIGRKMGMFPETIWALDIDSSGKPKAKKSGGKQLRFLTSSSISARCEQEDGTDSMFLQDKVEPCELNHYLPFWPGRFVGVTIWPMLSILGGNISQLWVSKEDDTSSYAESEYRKTKPGDYLLNIERLMVGDDKIASAREIFREEVAKVGSFGGGPGPERNFRGARMR